MASIEKQRAVDVVRGRLSLNHEYVEELAAAFEECALGGQPLAVFDMQRVGLVDSAGLELLFDVQDGFSRRGGDLKIAAANGLCRDILKVVDDTHRLEVFDKVEEAVRSFLQ